MEIEENKIIQLSTDQLQGILTQLESIHSLREEIESLKKKGQEREKEIECLKKKGQEQDSEISTLTETVRTMRDLVQEVMNQTFDHGVLLADQELNIDE